MHELALIKKIVENAEHTAKTAGIKNVSILRMRIGKMTGFKPDQLNFLFETYEKKERLKNTKLEVEDVSVALECSECKHTFIDKRFDDNDFAHSISHVPLAYEAPSCPKCGANNGQEIIRGRELDLVDLEGE